MSTPLRRIPAFALSCCALVSLLAGASAAEQAPAPDPPHVEGVPAPPPLRARAQKRADEARERMGEAAFEAAWSDGARQTLADSVADAVTD